MARRPRKYDERRGTLGGAISDGFSEMQALRDELQEWYDNLPEGFQQGERGERLQEAIDALSASCDDEPDVPEAIACDEVKWQEVRPRDKRRGYSRSDRRDIAVSMLQAAADAVRAHYEAANEEADEEEAGRLDELNNLAEQLEEAISNFESAEFPGMYG